MKDSKSHSSLSTEPASQANRGQFFWQWFWRVFLVVSLAYAWYSYYVPSNSVSWAEDFASAQQQAAQSGKPMILFFTAKWCVPCRIMKRTVWADEQVETTVNAQFIPLMIDVDDPDVAPVLRRYPINGTPATIITDSQGAVLQQVTGGIGRSHFLELLEKLNPPVTQLLTP